MQTDPSSAAAQRQHSAPEPPVTGAGPFSFDQLPTPDYQRGDCYLFNCDALDLLPRLPEGCVDAVVTDPPYGIKWNCDYSSWVKMSGKAQGGNNRRSYAPVQGDDKPFDPSPVLDLGLPTVLWGFNCYMSHLSAGTVLVWHKRNSNFLAQAEAAWMNRGHGVYVFKMPVEAIQRERVHPTQKPVSLMEWCIERVGGQSILDPFMGSGTTGVACVNLGRKFIGVELSEEYFDIAASRIEKAYQDQALFEPA